MKMKLLTHFKTKLMKKIESLELEVRRGEINSLFKFFTSAEILDMRGDKYSYFVEKNINVLDGELKKIHKYNNDQIQKRGNLSEKFIEKEKDLLEKYCQKDENGNPVLSHGNRYNIENESMDEFKAKREAIMKQKQFKADVDKINAYQEAMQEYENGKIKIKLHRIASEHLPTDITPRIRMSLKDFIVE